MSKARESRERLGEAAIVSLDHAARLLPVPYREAKAWLIRQGIVAEVIGRQVVVWGDVLQAVRGLSVKVVAKRQGTQRALRRVPL